MKNKKEFIKKILKILALAILMAILIYLLRGGKKILDGLYIYFPIIFLLIGLTSGSIKELVISMLLTSVAFLIPINLWFNMGTCVIFAIIYIILSCIVFLIKTIIKKKNKGKTNSNLS